MKTTEVLFVIVKNFAPKYWLVAKIMHKYRNLVNNRQLT